MGRLVNDDVIQLELDKRIRDILAVYSCRSSMLWRQNMIVTVFSDSVHSY